MNGALLIHKPEGISSFGVVEALTRALWEKRRSEASALGQDPLKVKKGSLPKMGHGGTLDPFATGLLVVCVGRGVKLARYFLGSEKVYEATVRFGETTIPGDPTDPISETSAVLPASIDVIRDVASTMVGVPYLQKPPMHSAKKKDGKPLYELARQGIEVEREAKECRLYSFDILSYDGKRAKIRVACSAGTYIRTLAQDLGRKLGTVAMLDTLHRVASGSFHMDKALALDEVISRTKTEAWDTLPCFVPLNEMLAGYPRVEASASEALALMQGRQEVMPSIIARAGAVPPSKPLTIFSENRLVAIASRSDQQAWGLDRVFLD